MLFRSHPVSRDYFRSMPTFFENSCRVESWSAVLNKRARTRFRKPGKKETVFYVPAKLAGGAAHFNTPFYPATWYFEHQKKILNYFGQRPEYHFVYKHSSLQKWASSSVLRWLASQKFKNIEVIDGIFPKLMAQAHRVIFDYPSSGVFEAAAAGLPMLALYHRSMRLWEPMRQVFGPCLRPFSDTQEAVQTIHGYLNAPRRDYQIKLPAGDQENPFDVLEHDHEDQVR